MKALKNTRLVILRSGPALFGLTILITFIEQILTAQLEADLMSLEGASSKLWVYGGLSIFLSIISPVITSVLVVSALIKKPILNSLIYYWQSVFIETLRAAGKSLSWSLLLIIPGLIRFLQFSFIPFIVMLDPDYEMGQIDVLKKSTRLVNQNFFQVFGLIVLFSLIIPLILTSVDEYALFFSHPLSALALVVLETMISIVFILLLLKQWEKHSGTHV